MGLTFSIWLTKRREERREARGSAQELHQGGSTEPQGGTGRRLGLAGGGARRRGVVFAHALSRQVVPLVPRI